MLYITLDGTLAVVRYDVRFMSAGRTKTYGTEVISAAWSGERIAFVSGGSSTAITLNVLNPDGQTTDVLDTNLKERAWVTCSPAGDWLAVDFGTGFGRELALYRFGQYGALGRLGCIGAFAWSPDGAPLLLGRAREVDPPMPWDGGQSADVVIVDLETGAVTEVVRGCANAMYLPAAWVAGERVLISRLTPDGSRPALLSFDLTGPDEQPAPGTLPHTPDSEALRLLLPESVRNSFTGSFSWCQTLSVAAAVIGGADGPEIWIIKPDDWGGAKISRLGPGHSPAWRSTQ